MKKSDLLDELSSKFYKLGTLQSVVANPAEVATNLTEEIKRYSVTVYDQQGKNLTKGSVTFTVHKEGDVDEEAFYDSAPEKVQTFAQEVKTMIASKVTAGAILGGIIDTINEDMEFAVVVAYSLDTGVVSENKYFVYKVDTVLQFTGMN